VVAARPDRLNLFRRYALLSVISPAPGRRAPICTPTRCGVRWPVAAQINLPPQRAVPVTCFTGQWHAERWLRTAVSLGSWVSRRRPPRQGRLRRRYCDRRSPSHGREAAHRRIGACGNGGQAEDPVLAGTGWESVASCATPADGNGGRPARGRDGTFGPRPEGAGGRRSPEVWGR
jgi:hypothetical protein